MSTTHCDEHGNEWVLKTIPAGVNQNTGVPYESFQAPGCPVYGCRARPPKKPRQNGQMRPQAPGSPQPVQRPSAPQHPNAAADARLRAASAAWQAACVYSAGTPGLGLEGMAAKGYAFILKAYQGQSVGQPAPTPPREPGEDDDIDFGQPMDFRQ
jgi:hypothetical protein